jgi:hypothetical protein
MEVMWCAKGHQRIISIRCLWISDVVLEDRPWPARIIEDRNACTLPWFRGFRLWPPNLAMILALCLACVILLLRLHYLIIVETRPFLRTMQHIFLYFMLHKPPWIWTSSQWSISNIQTWALRVQSLAWVLASWILALATPLLWNYCPCVQISLHQFSPLVISVSTSIQINWWNRHNLSVLLSCAHFAVFSWSVKLSWRNWSAHWWLRKCNAD